MKHSGEVLVIIQPVITVLKKDFSNVQKSICMNIFISLSVVNKQHKLKGYSSGFLEEHLKMDSLSTLVEIVRLKVILTSDMY